MKSAPQSTSLHYSLRSIRSGCTTRTGWVGWCSIVIISGGRNEQQVMQIARQFCAEAARHMRDRRLDTEATVEAVLRLASFDRK